jgi:hypothetical protein
MAGERGSALEQEAGLTEEERKKLNILDFLVVGLKPKGARAEALKERLKKKKK